MKLEVIKEEEFTIKPFSHIVIGDTYALRRYEDAKTRGDERHQKDELKNIFDEKIPKSNRVCKVILRECKDSSDTDDFSMKVLMFYSMRKDIKWLEEEISFLKNEMCRKEAVKETKVIDTLSNYLISVDGESKIYDLGGDDYIGYRYHYKYNYMFFYKVYLPCDKSFDELKEDIKELFKIKQVS